MGWDFLDIDELPEPGDLLWCKWPQREAPGAPGPVARPVLVRESAIHEDRVTGRHFGALTVSYGTGTIKPHHIGFDLIIGPHSRAIELGLHKMTRFALDLRNRKTLIWCSEYFVPNNYLAVRSIHIGRLGDDEIEQMRRCLLARGLLKE